MEELQVYHASGDTNQNFTDSLRKESTVFIETRPSEGNQVISIKTGKDISHIDIPDWYFFTILSVVFITVWLRVLYGKFINSLWICAYSYLVASKTYNERGIVQKRFGFFLDLFYIINLSLFFYLVIQYFDPEFFRFSSVRFLLLSSGIISAFVFWRFMMMKVIGYIFNRERMFSAYLYHHFIYNKIAGLAIIPFLFVIPYTKGILQEALIFTGISVIIITQLLRLVRAAIFIINNVVLFFYLILYLCILEIIPILVVIKVIISLTQV